MDPFQVRAAAGETADISSWQKLQILESRKHSIVSCEEKYFSDQPQNNYMQLNDDDKNATLRLAAGSRNQHHNEHYDKELHRLAAGNNRQNTFSHGTTVLEEDQEHFDRKQSALEVASTIKRQNDGEISEEGDALSNAAAEQQKMMMRPSMVQRATIQIQDMIPPLAQPIRAGIEIKQVPMSLKSDAASQ